MEGGSDGGTAQAEGEPTDVQPLPGQGGARGESTGEPAQPASTRPEDPPHDAHVEAGRRSPKLRTHTLRDRIVEHLRATQADSISGIARELAATGEAPVHRLTVAGYLQAMAEAGTLRELDRPPSKLYQLQNPEAHWSLHQRVHRLLQESGGAEADRFRIALAVLQRILERPVFQAEMLHAGFHDVPPGIERAIVGDATRRHYRELFLRRASPRIDIPPRDPLLHLAAGDPWMEHPAVADTLRRLLLRAASAEHLVADRPSGPQQAQLDLGGAR